MSLHSLIIDTETHTLNGLPIEIAYVPVTIEKSQLYVDESQIFDEFYSLDADTEIHIASMAVHHILPSDLINKPLFNTFRLPSDTVYLIGHNIDYDVQAIARCGQDVKKIKPICTLALSRLLWPRLESHSLSTLSYYISSDLEATRQQLRNAHNAKTDILLTSTLLARIITELEIEDIEHLFKMSQTARLPQIMPFGKYKGYHLKEVPLDYVQWLLRQPDLDRYLREALEQLF